MGIGIHTYFFGGAGAVAPGQAPTYYPASDSLIKNYGSEVAVLLGASLSHTAPLLDTRARIRLAQAKAFEELVIFPSSQNDAPIATGPLVVEKWGQLVTSGHSFDHLLISAGGDNFSGCVYALYGNPLKPTGFKKNKKQCLNNGDASTTAWTEESTLTGLDPFKVYGLTDMEVQVEDAAALGGRLNMPSIQPKPGVIAGGRLDFVKEFGCLAGLFSGRDTLSFEALALAATQIDLAVGFEEYADLGGYSGDMQTLQERNPEILQAAGGPPGSSPFSFTSGLASSIRQIFS